MCEAEPAAPAGRIAVLLAAYNGVAYLQEQIDSILFQQDVDVHVFVSVDASTDGTETWVENRARADRRVTLLPTGQRFGGAAPNFLRLLRDVDVSGFDAVAYADQDDRWYPDKLARALSELARTGAAGYSSNVLAFWPSGREMLIDKARPQRRWDHLFEAAGPGCTYVLSRALALALQARVLACRESLLPLEYHDWFSYAFARAQGWAWHIDARPGLHYRQHASNQIGVNSGGQAFARRARRVLAGHAFAQARLIAGVVGAHDTAPLRWLARGRVGLLALAWHAGQCRRAPRDRLYFFLMCLAMAAGPGMAA